MKSIIAVDTGGTFTDVVHLGPDGVRVLKLPSTPDDPARAVLEGVRAALAGSGEARRTMWGEAGAGAADGDTPSTITAHEAPRPGPGPGDEAGPEDGAGGEPEPFVLVHGSTVATNALLERKGARVLLVTNRGFEDILELGRQNRPQLYALVGERPPPLAASGDRLGIAGRVGPDGREEEPLDPAELEALPARLAGAESVAVCLLHSYANLAHEAEVGEALEALGVPVTLSSRLLPEYREYERTATVVVNAFVAPQMDRYLAHLEESSGAERVRIMGSAGGAVPVGRARREPVHTVLSGPAGGVLGALAAAREVGVARILAFDMGGTSTDVSLCPGRPLATREFAIAGVPVAVPVLDIHTVGAGGGSLAWVDAGGSLRVGPHSAGARPGPICYGLGGSEVTVTDAHVWSGRLPSDAFLGGRGVLDRGAIGSPLEALGRRLGLGPEETAEGIVAIVETAMEGALRVISVERGHDPRDFSLVAFGGAAGLHAAELAARLGIPRVVVPPDPGVLSAYGMVAAPVRKDVARSVLVAGAEAGAVESVFEQLAAEALAAMEEEGLAPPEVRVVRRLDARYRGQSFELQVPADGWVDAFHTAHERRYGYRRPDLPVEAVTLRVEATGPLPELPVRELAPATVPEPPDVGRTRVLYRAETLRAARVDRAGLRPGHRLVGPAVVTEYTATTWLPPGWRLEVAPSGALLLSEG